MKTSAASPLPPPVRTREPGRSRLVASVPRVLRERLSTHCAAGATNENAVVTAALYQYFENANDKELLLRRLDRLDQAAGQLLRGLDLQSEAFAVFIKIWFAHTPSIGADGRRAALAVSETRYRQFVEYVAARMASGMRFALDLPPERVASDGQKTPTLPQHADPTPQTGAACPRSAEGHGPE